MYMMKDGEQSGAEGAGFALPSDLLTSREACAEFSIAYSTLMGWWNRGIVRRWKRGMFNLVSRAEVADAVRRYQTIHEVPPHQSAKSRGDGETSK